MRPLQFLIVAGLAMLAPALQHSPAAESKPDYSHIRGANYIPTYANTSVAIWKNYQPQVIDRELGYAERLKLNSIRVFLQYVVYEHNPQQFLERLDNFLQLAGKHHLNVMFVLFDSCFGDEPAMDRDNFERWVNSPGFSRIGQENWPKLERYVGDIVRRYRGDSRVLMWDVMNEPMADFQHVTVAEREKIWRFVRHFCQFVKKADATHPITVGEAVVEYIPKTMDLVDVLSVHSYLPYEDWFRKDIELARTYGRQSGKPIMVTEFGNPGAGQSYEMALDVIERERVGFYFFELMIGKHMFRDVQGLFYPDGSVRDLAPLARLLGFRVKRDGIPLRKSPAKPHLKQLFDDPSRWEEALRRAEGVPRTRDQIVPQLEPIAVLGRFLGRPSPDAGDIFDAALSIPHLFRLGHDKEAVERYERMLKQTRKAVEATRR